MRHLPLLARAAGVSALLIATALPAVAYAGEADRARAAINAAKGKIEAGDRVGADGEAGAMQARARSTLQTAETELADGRKDEAIRDAQHAGDLADQAIVTADHRKVAAERDQRRDAETSAAAAQQSAADANARADSAQAAAASAQAQADALRNAPPPPPPPPATVTTVTTDKVLTRTPAQPARTVTRRVVHKPATPAVIAEKTTTTVTTDPAPQ